MNLNNTELRPAEVQLVQSGRFPNVWSLVGSDVDTLIFVDPLFANGAMSAEQAVLHAREAGWRITGIQAVEGSIKDPRTGREVDPSSEVIAGIEYRTRRPVVEPEEES